MKIEVVNLTRRFGNTTAVDHISFSFQKGQAFAFVGPNGAGKTTTMRMMATLDLPDEGDVLYDGVSAMEYPENIRKIIGFVPDTLPLQQDTTVHEYLDFFARAYGLHGKKRTQAVAGVEEFTGVMELRDKLVTALSKGMRQRVNLSRALVHNPQVLILDEPAAGLDPRARIELRELLKLLTETGKAILISSHILTELTELTNGVIIIEQGKLLESGSFAEVSERRGKEYAIAVRTADDAETLYTALIQQPQVENARREGDRVLLQFHGDDNDAATMLAQLISSGIRICDFHPLDSNLEDLFMQITKGKVQ